jgi:hypothetical protein
MCDCMRHQLLEILMRFHEIFVFSRFTHKNWFSKKKSLVPKAKLKLSDTVGTKLTQQNTVLRASGKLK